MFEVPRASKAHLWDLCGGGPNVLRHGSTGRLQSSRSPLFTTLFQHDAQDLPCTEFVHGKKALKTERTRPKNQGLL